MLSHLLVSLAHRGCICISVDICIRCLCLHAVLQAILLEYIQPTIIGSLVIRLHSWGVIWLRLNVWMHIEWCKCEVLVWFTSYWESVGYTFREVIQLLFLVLDEAHSCHVFGLGGVGPVIRVVLVSCMIWYHSLVLTRFALDSSI